jgi:predicted SnoaL-like aldol condensation-catalyzing enzyme
MAVLNNIQMENISSRSIVLAAYKHIIGQCNTVLIDTYISNTYIQHSPTVKDGKAGLTEMIEFLKKVPRTGGQISPIVRTIEDGDLVAVHLDVTFMGKRMAVIDIFRVQDGKIAEHWDAVQACPELPGNNLAMTNGATAIEQLENTAKNKLLVQLFCEELLHNKNAAEASQMLSADYVEHELECLLSKQPGATFIPARVKCDAIKVHRILAEGNFTVVQSSALKENMSFVFYDVFRIENDKIAEHWGVQQAIPATMAHANGMI